MEQLSCSRDKRVEETLGLLLRSLHHTTKGHRVDEDEDKSHPLTHFPHLFFHKHDVKHTKKMFIRLLIRSHTLISTSLKSYTLTQLTHTVLLL